MPIYIVTVMQLVPHKQLMRDDQITDPAGRYMIQNVIDDKHALEVFNDRVSITWPHDFDISVAECIQGRQFDGETVDLPPILSSLGRKPELAKVGPNAERPAGNARVKSEMSDPDTKAISVIQCALDRWGLLNAERDHPINGGDLVEWFTAEFVPIARMALSPLNIRWKATITYRHDNGPIVVSHDLQELDEIDTIIDKGPHWDTIVDIKIVRVNHSVSTRLTVETAAKL